MTVLTNQVTHYGVTYREKAYNVILELVTRDF